jgi:hypothetical protein
LTEPFSEKYLKRLIGRTDIEDVLKRLDRLTQEEARMAAAQILKVANTVDDKVEGIANNMVSVDNRVAGVDDRVAVIDDTMKDVHDQVKDVNDQVKAIEAAVIDGAQHIFNRSLKNRLTNYAPRWKRGQGSHTTNSGWRRSNDTFVTSE